MESFAVIVLGGGPSGAACAIDLARQNHRVALLERSDVSAPRWGETFGAEIRPLLEELGAWDGFQAVAHVQYCGIRSAWGESHLSERSALLHPLGTGWHVDRRQFDKHLLACARRAGVSVQIGTGACRIERQSNDWQVTPAHGQPVQGTTLVDASGRGAPATAGIRLGRSWQACDRMIGVATRITLPPGLEAEPELLLETCQQGWWYSVPQPGGELLVALMTDADLILPGGRAARTHRWLDALAGAPHTRARLGETLSQPKLWAVRADTGHSRPGQGPNWRLIGDAAFACDPLAGTGVIRALQSGRRAATELTRDPGATTSSPEEARKFREFRERRGDYYRSETRWPTAPFWARRRVPEWHEDPLTLDPRTRLHWTGNPIAAGVLDALNAWLLGAGLVQSTLEFLRQPRPAPEALGFLVQRAQVDDRRALIALQRLVTMGLSSEPALQ